MEALDMEITGLLESLYSVYGYDFRDYAKAHIKRRLLQRLKVSGLASLSEIRKRLDSDPEFVALVLKDLSINVTEMFRDPEFYRTVRERVVPLLKTWSYVRIWHAGCSTGEEVYSMAILLYEEGLYERVQIYATDFNLVALNQGKEGIYSAKQMERYQENYKRSGAKANLSDYFHTRYDSVIMAPLLKKQIVWAQHNLVTDSDFAEVHMVMCRNVLIYFNQQLQQRVLNLFGRTLVNAGILCLGKKESIRFTDSSGNFAVLDAGQKIYKKRYCHE
ncbi:protein-glutamate O-methyltransferase CheR [Bowmanella denitrificans]|uniref:Protein-glutamate O-methyltransferase CheR n=1 Tax=Bowmanella denitrificans TaxID=366582 RepID=A0ABN0XMQ4_9ALTE